MTNKKFNLKKIIQSIFSALLGVQSRKNMEEDFATGKIQHYVIAGFIAVIIFILVIYSIVKYVVIN